MMPGATREANRLFMPSAVVLVVANLIPLGAVAWLGWSAFAVLALYWAESLFVGAVNVLKLILSRAPANAGICEKALAIAMFVLCYGLFWILHGFVVFGLFGNWPDVDRGPDYAVLLRRVFIEEKAVVPAALLLASHGLSFIRNFVLLGERDRAPVRDLIAAPFARVALLHVTIFMGAGLLLVMRNPVAGVLALVVLKTALDLHAHLRERRRYASRAGG